MSKKTLLLLSNAEIKQRDHLVLSHVSFTLDAGESAYLIGATGSGKSSLLKTLYGDLPLNSGNGAIAGFNLSTLAESEIPFLRRKLGIVFQDFQLLTDRTVSDNLSFVLKATGWKEKSKIDKRIQEVLDKVGMGAKSYKMPHQLSGGEQQRITIARALLNDPLVILADEPTGNLDPSTSEEIMILLREVCQNERAMLMATHDYALILKFPGRTLRCSNGNIEEIVQTSL